MQKKTADAYLDVFKHLRDIGVIFDELVMDYESGMRKAALEIYPQIKLSGCHFHHGQVKIYHRHLDCEI
jgi:hypothetical protein